MRWIMLVLCLGCSSGAVRGLVVADVQEADPGSQVPDVTAPADLLGEGPVMDEGPAPVDLPVVVDVPELVEVPDVPAACATGTQDCDGDNVRMCVGGAWTTIEPACPEGCVNGQCANCRPAVKRCGASGGVEVCAGNGSGWQAIAPCPQVCVDGACCSPVCGERTCGDDGCGGQCGPVCTGYDECVEGTCRDVCYGNECKDGMLWQCWEGHLYLANDCDGSGCNPSTLMCLVCGWGSCGV
jgi:hypothetical protein